MPSDRLRTVLGNPVTSLGNWATLDHERSVDSTVGVGSRVAGIFSDAATARESHFSRLAVSERVAHHRADSRHQHGTAVAHLHVRHAVYERTRLLPVYLVSVEVDRLAGRWVHHERCRSVVGL